MNIFDLLPLWMWLSGAGLLIIAGLVIWLLPALAAAIGKAIGQFIGALLETRAGVGLVVGIVMGAVGWFGGGLHTESQCNEAKVRAEFEGKLAAEQAAHAITKRDLGIAQNAAQFNTTATGWITSADGVRQETIRDQESKPAAADCHKLGSAGLKFLRSVGPD